MNRGYILLWRASVDNPMYFAEPFTRFQAWIDLLILSNHDERIVFIKGKAIKVKRGQVLAGEEYLAGRWKWSRGKVRRYLAYLSSKSVQQIAQNKDSLCGVITICNYDTYQSRGTGLGTADSTSNGTAGSTADGHQTVQQTDIPNTLLNNNKNTCASEDAREPVVKKEYSDEFLQFWEAYPKKRNKDYAYKAWKSKKPPIEIVLQKLTVAKKDPQWTSDGGKYIPQPSSWINAGGWKDEQGDLLTTPKISDFKQTSVNYMGQAVNKDGLTIAQFKEICK